MLQTTRVNILALFVCFVFSAIAIWILFVFSNIINSKPNGFIRLFPPNVISHGSVMDLKYNSYYLAGNTQNSVYLANYVVKDHFIRTSINLKDTHQIQLKYVNDLKLTKGTLISIDSPIVYIMDGITPFIYQGILFDSNVTRRKGVYFSSAIPLKSNSFIIKGVDKLLNQNVILKYDLNATSTTYSRYVLEKQIDGIFCTDGTLVYDDKSSKLVYAYYYRNEFICLDTNLNVTYKAKTKDTVTFAKLKVSYVKSSGQITLSSPPSVINKRVCLNSNWVFIQSNLRANNENKKVFNRCSVIDVYAMRDGKYQFSFYLPDYRGAKVRDLKVIGGTVVALYDHYIYTYYLNF